MIRKNKGILLLTSIIILLPAAVGLLLWNRLPAMLPTHWGMDGAADGQFGPGTAGAVTAFQQENGLPETGILDVFTFFCLEEKAAGTAEGGRKVWCNTQRGSRHHQPDADDKAVHHTGDHERCRALLGARERKT